MFIECLLYARPCAWDSVNQKDMVPHRRAVTFQGGSQRVTNVSAQKGPKV